MARSWGETGLGQQLLKHGGNLHRSLSLHRSGHDTNRNTHLDRGNLRQRTDCGETNHGREGALRPRCAAGPAAPRAANNNTQVAPKGTIKNGAL